MIYCVFRNDTIIEKLIEQKRKNKFDFKEKIFIKMQKKNEESIITKDDIETDFVEEILIVISKII